MSSRIACILVLGLFALTATAAAQDKGEPIDWQKARQILRKRGGGQELTREEKAYLERAMKARRAQGGPGRPGAEPLTPKDSTNLPPLTDLVHGKYKGRDGGLYGGGRNTPPAAHLAAAKKELAKIQPLDAGGRPSPGGKIVLLSVGMSNTTQEYSAFMQLADRDPARSPNVVLVDGARGGMDVTRWIRPGGAGGGRGIDIWKHVAGRLRGAGVTDKQVQAAWIKQAKARPAQWGEFPAHVEKFKGELGELCRILKTKFPNLRVIYLSSRIYAGYATGHLNPESYAYESAFAVRGLIRDQIKGDKSLNYDPAKAKPVAPILLWGPYLWADGVKGRKIDNLVYERKDLAGDGTHPSRSGRMKVARQLLKFFKTDPMAGTWFTKAETGK